jgi:hypothetical protein
MAYHQLSASLIHDFIANFAAYCIPASLDLIIEGLQAIADPQQGEVTTSSKSGKPWSEAEVNDLVDFLYEHWSQSSGGNFKVTIWKGLSTHLETRYKSSQSISMLKSKFGAVSIIHVKIFCLSDKCTVEEHNLSHGRLQQEIRMKFNQQPLANSQHW